MTQRFETTLRSTFAQALLDRLGPNFKIKYYTGTQPASVATALSGNTLLATLTADGTPGSVSSGAIDFDEVGFTQSNASHVTGTCTWISLTRSDDTRVYEFAVAGDGHTMGGTITTGTDVALGAWAWTAPGV